jgi:predicted dehydrogenase
MAQSKPVTVGIVGLGRIGWNHHAKILKDHPLFEVTACTDPLEERRAEAADALGCETFPSLQDFLASESAELAIICTRSVDHYQHTIAALLAGLHVVVEKPFAMSVDEADKMISAAEKARRILTCHQNRRHSDNIRFIRETIDSGILGEVFWIRHSNHGFRRRNDWQQLRKFGGGYLNNNGVHAIDACIQLLDSPVADVWGDMKQTVTPGDSDDFFHCNMRGQNGRLIQVDMSYACAFAQPSWIIAGTCGTLQADPKQKTATIKFFDPADAPPISIDEGTPMDRSYATDDELPWQEREVEIKPDSDEPDFFANLHAAIRGDGELLISPESARETIRVVQAVRDSAGWTD